MDDAYYTFTNDYIETVWWILRQIWDKDLLYQGHKVVPVLPALRHGDQQPRGGAGLQGRHRGFHLRALPAHGGGGERRWARRTAQARLARRLDHHAVDAHQQRRGRGAPGRHLRARREPRRALRARPRPRREGPRQEGRGRARVPGRRAARPGLRGAVRLHDAGQARPLRHRRRLRHDHRRHRHRAHRPGLRRGRHARRPGERPAGRQRRRHRGQVHRRGHAVGRRLRQGRRPGHHRRPQGPRPAPRRRALRAQLSLLLALRHGAALLRQGHLVRPHHGDQGPAHQGQRRRHLAPGAHQDTGASASGSPTTSTGRSAATATGARRCPSGAASRGTRTASGPSRSSARWRPVPFRRIWNSTGPTSTTSCSPAPTAAARCAACPEVIDAWFDSGSMPFAPVALPVRERGALPRALPRRLHLRGHRPDARLVLQPARRRHARRGPQLLQARRSASATSSTPTARR